MPPPRFTVADEPWDPPPNFAIADEPLDPSTLACVRRFIINSQDLILPEQSPKKPTKSLKERLKTSVLQLLVNKDTVLIHWTSLNRAIYGDFKLKVQVWQMFRALCSCFGCMWFCLCCGRMWTRMLT